MHYFIWRMVFTRYIFLMLPKGCVDPALGAKVYPVN